MNIASLKFLTVILIGLIICGACSPNETAATFEEPLGDKSNAVIYTAKAIVTMDEKLPLATAVAVEDGKIIAVTDDIAALKAELGLSDAAIDRRFSEDVVMPGFIDPHLHPIMAAVLLPMEFITPEDWTLSDGKVEGVRSVEGYRSRLKTVLDRFDSQHPKDKPFFSWGWHGLWHGEVTRELLNAYDTERPIFIWHRSFHEIVTNDAGLDFLGFSNEASFDAVIEKVGADPAHGNYEHGLFAETALAAAMGGLTPVIMSPAHLSKGFEELASMIRHSGVTLIADMATGIFADFDTETSLIASVFEREDMPVRAMIVPIGTSLVMSEGSPEKAALKMQEREASWPYDKMFLNNRVKLFADGAFFSQYMQMRPPGYLDGHEGKWLTKPEVLDQITKGLWAEGFSIHTHVNGDMGLEEVLSTLRALKESGTKEDQRFVFEHLGYSGDDQTAEIAELGALVSAQPNYVYLLSDKYAEEGLGPERAHAMNRLGSLERAGVAITLHSDLTMAPVDPLFLAWIAANRENVEGDIVRPDEAISLDTALKSITINAALALGLEDESGSITAGKRADFTILGQNPYDVGAKGLKDIVVKGVVFEGEFYSAP